MAQSIKLKDDNYWDADSLRHPMSTASWTASSSSAVGTNVTGTLTLTKGIWLVVVNAPTMSVTSQLFIIAMVSGTAHMDQQYFSLASEMSHTEIIKITSDTAQIAVQTGFSASTTYSNLSRGRMRAVKLSAEG